MFSKCGELLVEVIDDGSTEPPVWRTHDVALLKNSTDASGRALTVREVRAPRKRYWKFRSSTWAPSYLNAYIANGAVITAKFGDIERDEAARNAFQQAFPDRQVVMLRIDHIANGGGGIHCLTQPMLMAKQKSQ
jgi:agmatine deiminase